MSSGINLPRISPRHLVEFDIPFPPLSEQRRIAAILDQADTLRRKQRLIDDTLRGLSQSFLREIIGARHSGVKERELGEVCLRVTDGTHQSPTWADKGVPFIFVSNIRNGMISFETDKFVSQDTYNDLTRNSPIEVGDVLYTAVGSYGYSAVVETKTPFIFQRHIAQIKPKRECLNSHFLSALLESDVLRRQADRVAKGVAQKTVTLAHLKSFRIPVPRIDVQNIYASKSCLVDEVRARARDYLVQLDALFASLQHRAFRGEL